MITDPMTALNDSVPTARSFNRLSINNSASNWVGVHSTDTYKVTMSVNHARTNKGASVRHSFSVKVARRNAVTGIWEEKTNSYTENEPYVPVALTAADIADGKALTVSFLASAFYTAWRRGEP